MAVAGKKALIKVGGTPTTMTDEATTETVTGLEYQITATTKQILDRATAVVVKADDVEVTSGYTVDLLSGTVIFDSDQGSAVITVSGKYIPVSTAAECKEYKLTINSDTIDVTKFQDDWIGKIQGLKSAEGSLSRWLTTDTYFQDALIAGLPVVIELYSQSTNTPDRLFAILSKDEMAAVVAGANEESVSFESTDKMLAAYSS